MRPTRRPRLVLAPELGIDGRAGLFKARYCAPDDAGQNSPTAMKPRSIKAMTQKSKASAAERDPSDDPYRLLFEAAAIGINWSEPDGRLIEANRHFCTLVGYERDALVSRHIEDFTHPDDVAEDRRQIARLMAGEISSYSLQKRYIRKDGTAIPAQTTSSLMRGRHPYRIAIVEDLRPQQRASNEQRENAARLKSILDAVPDAMIVIDERGIIESFSPSAEA